MDYDNRDDYVLQRELWHFKVDLKKAMSLMLSEALDVSNKIMVNSDDRYLLQEGLSTQMDWFDDQFCWIKEPEPEEW